MNIKIKNLLEETKLNSRLTTRREDCETVFAYLVFRPLESRINISISIEESETDKFLKDLENELNVLPEKGVKLISSTIGVRLNLNQDIPIEFRTIRKSCYINHS